MFGILLHLRFVSAILILWSAIVAGTSAGADEVRPEVVKPSPSDLVEWLRAEGAYINEKLAVRHVNADDPSSTLGVFATADIRDGEIICEIPPDLIVKPTEARDDGMEQCRTIQAVAEYMKGENVTAYGRYLLSQPRGYTAEFWSDAGKSLLRRMLESDRPRSQQYTDRDGLPPHVSYDVASELEGECGGDASDPAYMHAAMMVIARADYDKMVPFYDMINHHNADDRINIRHNIDPYREGDRFDESGYEIAAKRTIRAGEELHHSYNRCTICYEYLDWFGTPEIFLHFGFVEGMPQRWLFDYARVKFDLDWRGGDESSGEVEVTFLAPPSKRGMWLLSQERRRLEEFATEYYGDREGVPEYEWESLWQYYGALYNAVSAALKSDAALSEDVWDLNDDWWVKDGTLRADDDEHSVLRSAIPRDDAFVSNDEL